jgi:hypothetical protein
MLMKIVVLTRVSTGTGRRTVEVLARPRTRYAAVKGEFLNATLPSMLPSRVVDRIIGRRLGLLPTLR